MAKLKKRKSAFDRDKWLKRYLLAAISRIWGWYPPRREVKDRAEKEGCENCGKRVSRREIDVDHVEPVVPVDTIMPRSIYWSLFLDRKFCGLENLQGLCKPCHKKKTTAENAERRKLK